MPHLTLRFDCLVRAIVRAFHGRSLLPTLLWALAHADAVAQPSLTAARLLAAAPHELERLLEDARPEPLPFAARQRVLAALPREGDVTEFDPRRARKVRTVTDLLSASSGPEPHALEIVDAPRAAVAARAQRRAHHRARAICCRTRS